MNAAYLERGMPHFCCHKKDILHLVESAFVKIFKNIFTKPGKCDIMTMPNNLNIHSYIFLYRIIIAFFAIQLSKFVSVKTLLLLDCIENLCYEEIVWRQPGLTFFGAVTTVAALFIFWR